MADLDKVVNVLKEKNVPDKDIGQFIVGLNNMLAQQIEIEIVAALGEKDFEELNTLDEKTAHAEISRRYKEITGGSIEQKTDQMLDGFVSGFLAEYEREKLQGKV